MDSAKYKTVDKRASRIKPASPGKFVLLGTGGHFTQVVVKTLLRLDRLPCVYIQYGSATAARSFAGISIESARLPDSLDSLLHSQGIACLDFPRIDLAHEIATADADFMLVACWPELISQASIKAVNCAALNLHPSLLPAFRGFDPIGDQLRSNAETFGVSLHLLSKDFDRGDIVAQTSFETGPARQHQQIERLAGEIGASLFVTAMANYPHWTLTHQD